MWNTHIAIYKMKMMHTLVQEDIIDLSEELKSDAK